MTSELNQSILRHFYRLNRVLRRQTEHVDGISDLTLLQMQALFYIKNEGRPMMSGLSTELNISPSSASLLVDRLIAADWLMREQDEQDRRVTYLVFTEQAKTRMSVIQKHAMARIERVFSNVDEKELRELDRVLAIIEDTLPAIETNIKKN